MQCVEITAKVPCVITRKRFGQHFLIQPAIAQRIVGLAGLSGHERVLEIGPGAGALTTLLAQAAAELWLIEIDRDLGDTLQRRFADDPTVRLVVGDALEVDFARLLGTRAPVVVVANLPYNISTPILMRLLQTPELFSRLVLMLQREVAARVTADPGTKVYGALSVMTQLVADVHTAFLVSPGAFVPRPKVESAVVVIEPRRPPPMSVDELTAVRRVVRTAFGHRRKQLGNALAALHPRTGPVWEHIGIDPRRRPETLSASEFVTVARAFTAHA